jgi:hypothetical protein
MDPRKKTLLPKQTNKNSGCQKCQELEDFGKLSLYLFISLSLSLSLSGQKQNYSQKKLWIVRMQKCLKVLVTLLQKKSLKILYNSPLEFQSS